jgi:GT2 family glycosyltransferase
MQRDLVAILIVTYNSADHIPALFQSLRAHTDLRGVALVVVDNASEDGTLRALEAERPRMETLEILPLPRNTGFTGGSNVALTRARALGARYVLLLNPDTMVTAGWLEALIAVMERRADVAAAQPLILLWDDPQRINSAGNLVHFCGFGYCDAYGQRISEAGLGDEVRSVAYASGAALCLRLSALDEVGDFDELLFLYHEECDLQIRLRQAGYDCVLVPTARVLHKYNPTFSPEKYGWLERNRWMVMLKDWPMSVLLAAVPVLAGVELAVCLFALQKGWLRQKVYASFDIAVHLRELMAARRVVQARRTIHDTTSFTGRIQLSLDDHVIITGLVNPLLSAYWRLVGGALGRLSSRRAHLGA